MNYCEPNALGIRPTGLAVSRSLNVKATIDIVSLSVTGFCGSQRFAYRTINLQAVEGFSIKCAAR